MPWAGSQVFVQLPPVAADRGARMIDLNQARHYQSGTQYDERPKIESALAEFKAKDHDSFFVALACVQDALGEDGRDLAERWAQDQGESRAREFRDVWRSCHQGKGYSVGTLYKMANEQTRWTYGGPLRAMSPEEVEAWRRSKAEADRLNQEEEARNLARAKDVTAELMAIVSASEKNPYLERKLVSMGYGMKAARRDDVARILAAHSRKDEGEDLTKGRFAMLQGEELLVVPRFEGFEAEPKTVELIDAAGTKYTLKGGDSGIWPTVPFPAPGTPGLSFYVGEGVATCQSVATAMQSGIGVSTGSNSRLLKAAQAIRNRYTDSKTIVLADLIKATGQPDPKAVEASRAVGGFLAKPDFGPGWTAAMGTDFNDLACSPAHGPDAVRACIEAAGQVEAEAEDLFTVLDRDGLMALPDTEYLIKPLFPTRGVTVIHAPSGAGKSFLALDQGAYIAEGRAWFGHRTKRRPVAYLVLEGMGGFKKRGEAWEKYNGRPLPSGVKIIPPPKEGFDIRVERDVDKMIATVIKRVGKGAVLYIDTLAQAMPGSEENSKDYGTALAMSGRIERSIEGLVVLVAHPGKDVSKGIRGSYALFCGLDANIELIPDAAQPDLVTWCARKVKDGENGIAHCFRREVVDLGADPDGDPRTSCVIVPDPEAEQAAKGSAKKAMTRKERDALMAFKQAAIEYGQVDEDGNFTGLPLEDWRAHFYMVSPATTTGSKRSAFHKAKTALINGGWLFEDVYGNLSLIGPGAEVHAETIAGAILENGRAYPGVPGRTQGVPGTLAEAKKRTVPYPPPLRVGTGTHGPGGDFEEKEKSDRTSPKSSFPGTSNPTDADVEGWEDI